MQDCPGREGPSKVPLVNDSFVQGNFLPQFPAPPGLLPPPATQTSFLPDEQRRDTVLRAHRACVLWPSAPQGPEEQEQEGEAGPLQEV